MYIHFYRHFKTCVTLGTHSTWSTYFRLSRTIQYIYYSNVIQQPRCRGLHVCWFVINFHQLINVVNHRQWLPKNRQTLFKNLISSKATKEIVEIFTQNSKALITSKVVLHYPASKYEPAVLESWLLSFKQCNQFFSKQNQENFYFIGEFLKL